MMTAHPSSSPDLRRPSGVGAAGAGSGLTRASLNSAGASDSNGAPALSWPPSPDVLLDLASDHSMKQIGEMYGKRENAVFRLAHAMGIKWPRASGVNVSKRRPAETPQVIPSASRAAERDRAAGPLNLMPYRDITRAEIAMLRARFPMPRQSNHPINVAAIHDPARAA